MAKTCFVLLLILFIVLANSDIMTVKAKLCEKSSRTWFGSCKDSDKCDKQCIEWEGAQHGSCHQREAKYMCFCYSECRPKDKNPTPSGKKPPPPDSGQPAPPPNDGKSPAPSPGSGQPSPPDGGQPTPPDSGMPAPSPGGGQSPPPDGGQQQPAPPDGDKPAPSPGGDTQPPPDSGKPAPPPGCSSLEIDKLIAEALANYKNQVDKASRL